MRFRLGDGTRHWPVTCQTFAVGRSGNPAKRAVAQERTRVQGRNHAPGTHAAFYCDESGNTGVHWGDPDQPVFVHGGWMILGSRQEALLEELPRFRERHRLNAPELKWQQLAKREKGAEMFRDILQVMIDNAAVPFFLAMDKDYLLAAKAVDTFFDPAYNHLLPMSFASAYDIKKDLAEHFLLAPAALAEFADMLRSGVEPEAPRIRRLASQFADVMAEHNAPALAEMLRHLTPGEVADIGSELGADVWTRTTTGHSMFALMQRLEQSLRPRRVRIEIVHDNIVRFDDLLGMVKDMFREESGNDVLVINGEIRFYSMPTVDSMRLGDSKEEPFIQLADLLVGFVRTVFTKLKHGERLDPDERAVCGDLVMLHQEFYSWDVNVPKATLEELGAIGWVDLKQRFSP